MSEAENVEEFVNIEDLKPNSRRVNVKVKVLSKNEEREVLSRRTGNTLRVTEALVGDATGTILLTLWNDLIDQVEIDKCYMINNGYISLFKGSMRLNIGKYGNINEIEDEIEEINEDNNVSDKQFENVQYRRRSYYGSFQRSQYRKPYRRR
ncbi:MAG: single-stranded DNA-binding protein [Candidatus Odinarchaeia archaeon]